jgi:hypothetical protein
VTGELFHEAAKIFIDGQEVAPKQHDNSSFVLKQVLLQPGVHEIRVVNPDEGFASYQLTV